MATIVRVLLVDSNLDDQYLGECALNDILRPDSTVNVVNSGNEAVAYMIGEGKYADREKYPFPTVIITELNMNDGDGFHVLEFLAHNPAWSVVPRIILSGSNDNHDVRLAYELGASAYHVKPHRLVDLKQRMRAILEYWASSEAPPVDKMGRLLPTHSQGRGGGRYKKPGEGGRQMERP